MSHTTEQKKEHTAKVDVYQMVTDRIIQLLEKGVIPWKKQWLGISTPRNYVTDNAYRGVNLLMLASLGYSNNYFLTFKQVKDLGGKIKKGEHSHLVVYWQWKEQENETTGKREKRAYLRYYLVFNISQCEGIADKQSPVPSEKQTNDLCERVVEEYMDCPPIRHSNETPYYNTKEDYINMLHLEGFAHYDGYYSCLFQELIHSSGHRERLNREAITGHIHFGSRDYAIEELTAELGACYLKYLTGVQDDDIENSAAYIQSWLKVLKNDKTLIIKASGQAQKAVDYILNIDPHDSIKESELVHAQKK